MTTPETPEERMRESVTQEDRQAAAAIVRWQITATKEWAAAQDGEDVFQFFVDGFSRAIVQGIWDEHEVVQAFARHRLASERAAIERCVAIASKHEQLRHGGSGGSFMEARRSQSEIIRDEIRSLIPGEPADGGDDHG